jgi:ketosteroid isomerase-like protein
MSQENVEIVRRSFAALERSVDAHWRNPRSVVDAVNAGDLPPELRELFTYLDPNVEWNTAFANMSFHGHLGCATGWDWLFEVAEDYRVTLVEVTDLGANRVLAEVDRTLKGKGSEIEVSAPMFSVVTLRGGLIARMDEYSSRAEAEEAVRPSPPAHPGA